MTLLETLRALAPVVTPGDWEVKEPMDHGLRIVEAGKETYEWRFIAGLPWPDGHEGIPRKAVEANAALIVALRNALPAIIAALETVALIRDEDWLSERISDSLDMDWRPIDAARAIIAGLEKEVGDAD